MKKISKYLIGGVILALAVGVVAVWRSGGGGPTYETETIGKGTVVQEVTVTGSLQPAERVSLEPEVSGRVTDILVTEGDEVKAGDPLIRLDDRDLQSRIASQRAAAAAAKATLMELTAGPTAEDLTLSQSSVDAARSRHEAAKQAEVDAEASLKAAQNNLASVRAKAQTGLDSKAQNFIDDMRDARVKAGDAMGRLTSSLFTAGDQFVYSANNYMAEVKAVSTRKSAKAALTALQDVVAETEGVGTLDSAVGNYDDVTSELTDIKEHIDATADLLQYVVGVSSATVESHQANLSAAQTNLAAVTAQLIADKSAVDVQRSQNDAEIAAAEISATSATTALNTARAAVDTADKSVRQALAEYDLKKSGARPENIDAQRARVLAEEAALGGLLTDLSKRLIASPIDGVVTDVNVERGETVSPGVPAIALNAQGRFEIVSNISEVDIAKVQVGQPVEITLDAFSRSVDWRGKVTKIFPAEKVVDGVIFYETKVVFDEDDPQLKSGMTANLSIETARKEDVLRVPLRALKEQKGKDFVSLLVGGVSQEVEVRLGVENSVYAELVDGAKEGDLVIVAVSD